MFEGEKVIGKAPLQFIVWYDDNKDFTEQMVTGIIHITYDNLYFSKEKLYGKIPIKNMDAIEAIPGSGSDLMSTVMVKYHLAESMEKGTAFLTGFEFLMNAIYNLLLVCTSRHIRADQSITDLKKSILTLTYLNLHDHVLWKDLLNSEEPRIKQCVFELVSEGLVNEAGKLTPRGFSEFMKMRGVS